MNGLPTITAAIITFGEADNLRRLLGALDWVDQIVVVDGGSSDDTVSIAEAHGCLVERRRLDSFAAQRNRAIELSTSDWVLSVDADELPSQRLVAEIRQRIVESRADAFHVPIRSTIFGRPLRRGGTQNDWPVRLFRRGKARWRGDVHEVLRVDGRVGRLDNWLIHRTTPDLATFLAKMHRYALLEAAARVKAGRRPRRRDSWLAPPGEVFRRLFWKQGFLDGPAGWAFCLLSGLSEWVIARKHLQLWNSASADQGSGLFSAVAGAKGGRSCQPNTDDALLLPLMLDNVPPPLIEALRQEGIPVRDCRDPGRPARFVLFDSREGPCRKADWQVAIDVDEIRRRWPNDPLEELGSEDSALHQWRSGGLTVTEEIAAVDRRAVRRRIMQMLCERIEQAGGAWLCLDAFPFPYRNALNFRIDYDRYEAADFESTLRVIAGNEGATSHFVSGAAFESRPRALARLAGLDVGSHGFHHHTYRTTEENLENIYRGLEVLRAAGIEASGFAAPGGHYNRGLAAALESLQPAFSSEFALAYDDLPFTPAGSSVLQVPIHPVCLGIFLEASSGGSSEQRPGAEQAASAAVAYFRAAVEDLYRSGCPMFFYGHPTGRLGRYPEVLRTVLEAATSLPSVWKTTMTEFAAWWKQRDKVSLSVASRGELLEVTTVGSMRGYRLAVRFHHRGQVARVPIEAGTLRFLPSALTYESGQGQPGVRPVRVDRPGGLRGSIRRMIDWELETPAEEITGGTWRNRVKRTLRKLHA